jgi:hypothetical protein
MSEAEINLCAALALDPRSIEALILLGRVHLYRAAYRAAEIRFRDCLSLGSKFGEVFANLAASIQNQERYGEAIPWYRKAIEAGCIHARAGYYLAACLFAIGKPKEALSNIENMGDRSLDSLQRRLKHFASHFAEALNGPPYCSDHPVFRRDMEGRLHLIALCRHSINLDHFLPIIHAWMSSVERDATVLFTGAMPDADDFRMRYLQYLGVEVVHVSEMTPPGSEPGCECLLKMVAPNSASSVFVCERGHNLIDICFATGARTLGIPVVGIAPGEDALMNQMVRPRQIVPPPAIVRSHDHLDIAGFSNMLFSQGYQCLTPNRGQPVYIGSARYCREWLEVLRSLVPPTVLDCPEGALRVVLFLIDAAYAVHWSEVMRTVLMLIAIPRVCVVVQPHPRSIQTQAGVPNSGDIVATMLGNLRETADRPGRCDSRSRLVILERMLYGASLVEWGDIFMSFGTSITYQAVVTGKPVLELSYAHSNYATIAHFIKVSDMRCLDDVRNTVLRMLEAKEKGKQIDFYDNVERERFVNTLLEPDGKNPLQRHVDLLVDLIKTKTKVMNELR